jgi:hypothetical protein
VTVVFEDERSLWFVSAAFVALITQEEPALPGVNEVPTIEQVPETTTNDTDPEPDPPDVNDAKV